MARALFFAVAVASLPGCLVSSLHPIYDDSSIVFDESLVGTWENTEVGVSAVVARGEWRSYDIAFTDRTGTTRFTGHLTTIGTSRLLNIRPEDGVDRPAFIVATNGFVQIETDGCGAAPQSCQTLRVREPDYDVVTQRLNARKLGVDAVTDPKQNVMVTAPSAKLRTWLRAALKDPSLWADWKTFTRSAR